MQGRRTGKQIMYFLFLFCGVRNRKLPGHMRGRRTGGSSPCASSPCILCSRSVLSEKANYQVTCVGAVRREAVRVLSVLVAFCPKPRISRSHAMESYSRKQSTYIQSVLVKCCPKTQITRSHAREAYGEAGGFPQQPAVVLWHGKNSGMTRRVRVKNRPLHLCAFPYGF